MTILDPQAGHITLINTFEVEPGHADELLAVLSRATDDYIRTVPGFISANLHVSFDKKNVANYAQWRSQADLDAFMADPQARAHMHEAAAIATSFRPLLYALRETRSGPGAA
ncbi:MAG: antibiotic biosynthesis monooxygenase family protein [Janthinobacterium lividum]